MIVSVPKETVPGEQRVALVPEFVPRLAEAGLEVAVQSGAGELAGFFDDGYAAKGARLEAEVFDKADILLKVQPSASSEEALRFGNSRYLPSGDQHECSRS